MKLLIDECLHTSLVALAHDAGPAREHVNLLGLGGYQDWQLMAKIRGGDFTLVTNNRTDFTAPYAKEELHAGLVIITPNVTPSRQRDLSLSAANTLIQVHEAGRAEVPLDLRGLPIIGSQKAWRR